MAESGRFQSDEEEGEGLGIRMSGFVFSLPLDSFRNPPLISFFLSSILIVFAASSRFWGKVVMGMF